jgi:predicted HicB family RNase H-like nuclease
MSMPSFSGTSVSAADVQEIYRAAYEKFRQAANWVEFYREIFGVRGLLRQALPLPHQYHQFQQTQEYVEIQRMLAKLRQRSGPIPDEETKVITVRIPRSLYEALRKEAYDHQTSLNQYCISKLVQLLDSRIFSESEDTAPVMTPPEPLPHEPAPVSTPK